jgi:hypothetical protein
MLEIAFHPFSTVVWKEFILSFGVAVSDFAPQSICMESPKLDEGGPTTFQETWDGTHSAFSQIIRRVKSDSSWQRSGTDAQLCWGYWDTL